MTQKGVGRTFRMAKYRAMATKAFSPPDSRDEGLQGLARGLDLDLDAAVQDVLRVLQLQRGLAAAEQLYKSLAGRPR